MISKGRLLSAGVEPQPEFSVSVSPSAFFEIVPNGSYTTPLFTATVVGGTGPFTYEWVITGDEFSLTSTTGDSTNVKSGGFNDERFGTLTVTATDTGDGNAQAARNTNISINFGGA